MTLVATGPSGERLDLSTFDDARWDAFRASGMPLRCPGCGGPVHSRAIPIPDPGPGEGKELRLFAHNPGAGQRCRELGYQDSAAHDRLKSRIAKAARSVGWSAELEVQPTPACRADVVVTNPSTGRTRAIEAQISPLNTADAVRRHKLYEEEFGACTWTHTREREWASQIPSLQVDQEDQSMVVGGILIDLTDYLEQEPTPIPDVVADLLEGRLIYTSDTHWGSYVRRSAMSSGSRTKLSRRPRRAAARAATRFCQRFREMGGEGQALIRLGITSTVEFNQQLAAAHQFRRRYGEMALSPEQLSVLAAAHEYPLLRVHNPVLDARVRAVLGTGTA